MSYGFQNNNSEKSATVSVNALRGQALKQLAGVQQRLGAKGVGAAFLRAAKSDPIGDMGFVGSLMASLILWSPITSMLGHAGIGQHGLLSHFNHMAVSALIEGAMIVIDDKATDLKARAVEGYPEGRRKEALTEGARARKFNLLAANQNSRFGNDVQSELACMFDLIDLLDKLEQQGVKEMRLDKKQPVYKTLQQTHKNRVKNAPVMSFAAPMRIAA